MTDSQSRKQRSHDRIVAAAARAVRRSGYAGTGVADIMKEAGLTHGGFYAHFASRDALLAAAVEQAGRESAARMDAHAAAGAARGVSPLRALIEGYLDDSHRGALETGCVVSALASEVPRQAPDVRAASAQRVRKLIERVRRALPARSPAGTAESIASAMVGALMLARALDDEQQAAAMLRRVRVQLLAQHDAQPG